MISNYEYCRAFYMTARLNSFSAAANALHLTQPAVSQSVRKLESELGTRLFLREHQTVKLTEAGKLLYDHIERAVAEIESGEQAVEKLRENMGLELKLGTTETAMHYSLPEKLKIFREKYPEIRITMQGYSTGDLIARLKEGKLDIALLIMTDEMRNMELPADIRTEKLLEIRDVAAVSRDFPADLSKCYSLEELSHFPIIAVDENNSVRRAFDSWFLEKGVRFQPSFTVQNMNQVLMLTEKGIGIGLMPEKYARKGIECGELKLLSTETAMKPRSLVLAYRQGKTHTEAAGKFIKLWEQEAAGASATQSSI